MRRGYDAVLPPYFVQVILLIAIRPPTDHAMMGVSGIGNNGDREFDTHESYSRGLLLHGSNLVHMKPNEDVMQPPH